MASGRQFRDSLSESIPIGLFLPQCPPAGSTLPKTPSKTACWESLNGLTTHQGGPGAISGQPRRGIYRMHRGVGLAGTLPVATQPGAEGSDALFRCSKAAPMKAANSGCGRIGCDLNSG